MVQCDDLIFMSPGAPSFSYHFGTPAMNEYSDKLKWRKSVRYWKQNLVACVHGRKKRSKGTVEALVMTLFCSLPIGKKQHVNKECNAGELISDPSDTSAPPNECDVIEAIIATVDNDSAAEKFAAWRSYTRRRVPVLCSDKENLRFRLALCWHLTTIRQHRQRGPRVGR